MSVTKPGYSKSIAPLLLLLTVVVCLVIHLRSLGGSFLSDDFALTYWLGNADSKGLLFHWLLERFYLPLESEAFIFRPVAFASFAIDWLLYGTNAWGWHLSNLLVHLTTGALVYLLAVRLARWASAGNEKFVALASAMIFLAIPFAGESTFWPAGRYTTLATLFSMAFLVFLTDRELRHTGESAAAHTLAMVVCLMLALLSNESAMPIPAMGLAWVFAFRLGDLYESGRSPAMMVTVALRQSLIRYWPVLVLTVAFFAWRYAISGSFWKVYSKSEIPGPTELMNRIYSLRNAFQYFWFEPAGVWKGLLLLTSVAWLAGLPGAMRRSSFTGRVLTVLLFLCCIGYLLAPASSFTIILGNGEGMRHLYMPWAMFSLFFGMVLAHYRFRTLLLSLLLLMALWGQWRMVTLWQDASGQMLRISEAIPALADGIDEDQFALLLLPDHVQAVPFGRNAQGSLVMPPIQDESFLPKLAGLTPNQFEEWTESLNQNVIRSLKGSESLAGLDGFLGVYCWQTVNGQFHKLSAMPNFDDATAWKKPIMTEAVQAGCLVR